MRTTTIGLVLLAAAGCSRDLAPAAVSARDEAPAEMAMAKEEAEPAPAQKADREERKRLKRAPGRGGGALGSVATEGGGAFAGLAMDMPASPEADEASTSEKVAATRAWFPETFLFEPLVVTDDAGFAKVAVRVPDRLTTWRVLALAHSREGAQAGAESSFLGTLPTYLDPVVPAFLMAGDQVSIPIQVVNTTEQEVVRSLRVEATGAGVSRGAGTVKIGPYASRVEYIPVSANRPGLVVLKASLGDKDAVEKSFTVHPTGRPVTVQKGGTLAAPRAIGLELPADADPQSTTARLLVFPGALAILRAELSAASSRGGVAGDAYALLLAGRGEALLRSLGGEPDPKALRALAIVAGQRVIRAARSPDVSTAALLTEAALAHPDNPVLSRLGDRLAETVARGQRPDGTFEGASGWTLQRLLAATADGLRAVRVPVDSPRAKQRSVRATLASSGAFERNIERVEDAYTAASILATGAVQSSLAEKLAKRVRDGIKTHADGSRSLPVEAGVLRGDGTRPSEVEATALAALGLLAANDPEAKTIVPDLGASLLAAYSPSRGFGDGRTNLVALKAVLALFEDPLPERVKVTLDLDGRPIAEGVLEGAKLRDTLALGAQLSGAAGAHTYGIRAEPPVPGLGFSLSLETYVPWKKEDSDRGLELTMDPPAEPRVGRPVDLAVAASAPAGLELELDLALPAGVTVDHGSLLRLRIEGEIRGFEDSDGRVVLTVPARQPGQTFSARFTVIPTLAGTLQSGASSITAGNATGWLPPAKWIVK